MCVIIFAKEVKIENFVSRFFKFIAPKILIFKVTIRVFIHALLYY